MADEDDEHDPGQRRRRRLVQLGQLGKVGKVKQSDEDQVAKVVIGADVAGEPAAVEVDEDGENGKEDHGQADGVEQLPLEEEEVGAGGD